MKISAQAHQQLVSLLNSHPNQFMRIEVKAGGCSGFERVFELSQVQPLDVVIDNLVVVDPTSLDLLGDAVLNWSSTIGGNTFVLDIPDAHSNCGCGKSFSI